MHNTQRGRHCDSFSHTRSMRMTECRGWFRGADKHPPVLSGIGHILRAAIPMAITQLTPTEDTIGTLHQDQDNGCYVRAPQPYNNGSLFAHQSQSRLCAPPINKTCFVVVTCFGLPGRSVSSCRSHVLIPGMARAPAMTQSPPTWPDSGTRSASSVNISGVGM